MLFYQLNMERASFLNKSVFEVVKKTDFENIKLNIPEHYDIYLRSLYGDYMKLPDEIDRTPDHYKIYMKEV